MGTKAWPNEPVPPVIRIEEFRNMGMAVPVALASTLDANHQRVTDDEKEVVTVFVGSIYETEQIGNEEAVITKYYFAGSQRIGMRKDGVLTYLLTDQLGSTSLAVDASGAKISEMRYKPWGEVRYESPSGSLPTDYTYTGQRSYTDSFGLMYYGARWLDVSMGRFAQADSIIPSGVQGMDRFAYSNNNPVRYTDPTGHKPASDDEDPPVPDGDGFCIKKLGCSGTLVFNIKWIKWNVSRLPYEIFDRRLFNAKYMNSASTSLTDAALTISSAGAGLEAVFAGAGVVDVGPAGAVPGGILGNMIYQVLISPLLPLS